MPAHEGLVKLLYGARKYFILTNFSSILGISEIWGFNFQFGYLVVLAVQKLSVHIELRKKYFGASGRHFQA